jgi:hypothetical protein
VALSILTVDVPSVTVDARLNTEDEEFYYYTKTVLSTVSPSIIIKTDKNSKPLEFTDNKDIIKFNKAFSLLTDNFEACKISIVEMYYSNKNDFNDVGYFEKDNIYSQGAWYDKEGFSCAWGDNASVFATFQEGQIWIGQMPGQMTAGSSVTINFSAFYNNKIVENIITVVIKEYEDPETAPEGTPASIEKDITLTKPYDAD